MNFFTAVPLFLILLVFSVNGVKYERAIRGEIFGLKQENYNDTMTWGSVQSGELAQNAGKIPQFYSWTRHSDKDQGDSTLAMQLNYTPLNLAYLELLTNKVVGDASKELQKWILEILPAASSFGLRETYGIEITTDNGCVVGLVEFRMEVLWYPKGQTVTSATTSVAPTTTTTTATSSANSSQKSSSTILSSKQTSNATSSTKQPSKTITTSTTATATTTKTQPTQKTPIISSTSKSSKSSSKDVTNLPEQTSKTTSDKKLPTQSSAKSEPPLQSSKSTKEIKPSQQTTSKNTRITTTPTPTRKTSTTTDTSNMTSTTTNTSKTKLPQHTSSKETTMKTPHPKRKSSTSAIPKTKPSQQPSSEDITTTTPHPSRNTSTTTATIKTELPQRPTKTTTRMTGTSGMTKATRTTGVTKNSKMTPTTTSTIEHKTNCPKKTSKTKGRTKPTRKVSKPTRSEKFIKRVSAIGTSTKHQPNKSVPSSLTKSHTEKTEGPHLPILKMDIRVNALANAKEGSAPCKGSFMSGMSACRGAETLLPGVYLQKEQSLYSQNGHRLFVQEDWNVCLWTYKPKMSMYWCWNHGQRFDGKDVGVFVSNDGRLCVGNQITVSGRHNSTNYCTKNPTGPDDSQYRLTLRTDGNLILIRGVDGNIMFQSNSIITPSFVVPQPCQATPY